MVRAPIDFHRSGSPAAALAILVFATAGPAAAGPWEATTRQGLTVRITQDSFRARDAYLLERVYPDGTPDAGFGQQGQQGQTRFTLGPDNEGPAALQLDSLGRPWVAGASAGPGDTLQAVVLRFLPSGLPDPSYGDGGRSANAPGGRRARALDLAPQADGSTFVAGQVLDSQGQERTGWWRLGADGRVDNRFGLGGLWIDEGGGSTDVLSLSAGADGSLALALRRGEGASAQLEAWVLAPGATAPALAMKADDAAAARLSWRDGQWQWTRAAEPLSSAGPAAPAASVATRAAAGGAGPASVAQAPAAGLAPARPGQPVAVGNRVGWAALGVACLAALGAGLMWLRRARATARGPQ